MSTIVNMFVLSIHIFPVSTKAMTDSPVQCFVIAATAILLIDNAELYCTLVQAMLFSPGVTMLVRQQNLREEQREAPFTLVS